MPSEQVSPALQEEHLSGHLLSLRTSSSMIVSFLKELTFPEVLLRGLGRGRDPAGAKNRVIRVETGKFDVLARHK